MYSFAASSLEDIEYEIKEPIRTKTFEFTQFESTFNSYGLIYTIKIAGSDIKAPEWISVASNKISISTNDPTVAGEYQFVLVGDINDRAFYPEGTTKVEAPFKVKLLYDSESYRQDDTSEID